ncbi:MAG: hypothetical protein MJ080_00370 [Clostridia bacterium]|nr:hypothetical protein [Clostridia bacterium]
MEDFKSKYFLAANSYKGFISKFKDNYFPEKGYRVYIIKGGPGTGKSSFMKKIAEKAKEKGHTVTLGYCSSDPDSLDAVIIEDMKTLFFDGTAPHTLDPVYPGVCESIIDLGRFWNEKELQKNRYSIISAANINKAFHKTASLYLSACGEVRYDSIKIAKGYTEREKVIKFANALCRKYIQKKPNSTGFEHIRFLEAVTPKGIVSFTDTIADTVDRVFVINDKIGVAAGIICDYIRTYAVSSGYEIITVKNPYFPEDIIDHIIIPELNFAFVTENKFNKFPKDSVRIHARRFYNPHERLAQKKRISFNEKVENELLYSAIQTLNKAKTSHDILEKYYIETMDFEGLNEFFANFTDNFF